MQKVLFIIENTPPGASSFREPFFPAGHSVQNRRSCQLALGLRLVGKKAIYFLQAFRVSTQKRAERPANTLKPIDG